MSQASWQSTASLANIKLRAELLKKVRSFFYARNVLEVETPLITSATIPDPHIASLQTRFQTKALYLQTSPEFCMKRLLASGSGAIFQICKAFRDDEAGRFHNPEFTILEWYRPGFDHLQLMDEVEALLKMLINYEQSHKISYQQLFIDYLQIDPMLASCDSLKKIAIKHDIHIDHAFSNDKDDWLNLLLTHLIEPKLGMDTPIFIYHFPASQAALSQIDMIDGIEVAERFEVYYKGVELANGFHELIDANEQLKRFEYDNQKRQQLNLPVIPLDKNFLACLDKMPKCSGVALGVDRVLMLLTGANHINEVITFAIDSV